MPRREEARIREIEGPLDAATLGALVRDYAPVVLRGVARAWPLVAAAGWVTGAGLGLSAAAAGLALVASLVARFDPTGAAARPTLGVALMGAVSLLVAAFAGHGWQFDMHMIYFAALAILIVFCDWRAVVAAAATVAVHHLTLSFLLPAAF